MEGQVDPLRARVSVNRFDRVLPTIFPTVSMLLPRVAAVTNTNPLARDRRVFLSAKKPVQN
jgi:hypothetical protein